MNPGKIAEMRAMLGGDVCWLSLADVEEIAEIAEDGATFAENARKKALGYAKAAGLWAIADDSGLVIDALDGAPGVISARFSGEKLEGDKRTLIDHRNTAKVLELLRGIPENKRTARFVCRLCLANPENVLIETGNRRKRLRIRPHLLRARSEQNRGPVGQRGEERNLAPRQRHPAI